MKNKKPIALLSAREVARALAITQDRFARAVRNRAKNFPFPIMTNPANKPTLKERIADARAELGSEKADSILADTLAAEKRKYDREFLPLRLQAEALEQVIKTPRTASRMPTPALAAKPQSDVELIREYDVVNTDEQRRAFWKKHEKAIEGAKIGGLILVSMMSAKPFSLRARLELPTSERELVLTPGKFRALSAYDRGKFVAQGGKVQPAKLKRSLFDGLHPRDQMPFVKDGGRVID